MTTSQVRLPGKTGAEVGRWPPSFANTLHLERGGDFQGHRFESGLGSTKI